MFQILKNKLQKIYAQVTQKLMTIFSLRSIDESTLLEVEKILMSADAGVSVTKSVIAQLKQRYKDGLIKDGADMKRALESYLISLLPVSSLEESRVFLLVGINGCGKTTFAGKLAYYMKQKHKKCLLVMADTFRAAAKEQLTAWKDAAGVDIFVGKEGQDPASVVFDGCTEFVNKQYDVLIIDTAGRLQTKEYLMRELEKIKKTVVKKLPHDSIATLLTIDAMLGQNSFDQAVQFYEATDVSGLIVTKLDGTARGGIVFSITNKLPIPISFISYGEGIQDIAIFNAKDYVAHLLGDASYSSTRS